MTMDDANLLHPTAPVESPDCDGPPDVQPPSRWTRLLTSWKLWTIALVLAVVGIGVSLGIRGYQRYQALRYLDNNHSTYELTADSEWITEWFGERAEGFRSVDWILLCVVSDESFSRISVFGELRSLSTPGSLAAVVGGHAEGEDISDEGIESLTRLSRLESISLNIGAYTDEQLARIFAAEMPLVHVTLNAKQPSHQTLEALTRIPTLESLEFVGLSERHDEDFRGVDPIPTLHSLVVGDIGPECARWVSQCTQLRRLSLGSLNVDQNLLQTISRLKELETLSFSFFAKGIDEVVLAPLVDLPRLETLELPTNAITWESLEALRRMPSLKRIVLNMDHIDDPDLQQAVEQEWELENLSWF